MNYPSLDINDYGCIKSREVVIYYKWDPNTIKAIIGRYVADFEDGQIGATYWMEEGYGMFVDGVVGWTEIPAARHLV